MEGYEEVTKVSGEKGEATLHSPLPAEACGSRPARHSRVCPGLLSLGLAFVLACMIGACTGAITRHFEDTVEAECGTLVLPGLENTVTVARDDFGIPLIEAESLHDLAMAMGYVHASDRLAQMVGFKLLAQGRISELTGPATFQVDVYMRTLGLSEAAQAMFEGISPENRALLESYAQGVNAYIQLHKGRLNPALGLAGYTPEPWRPMDTAYVFALLNTALSFNLVEEIAALKIMQVVGPRRAAWLVPVYPDEPIPFDEAEKLARVDLARLPVSDIDIASTMTTLKSLGLSGLPASNNWAISSRRTAKAASILANDTHLLISLPSLWCMMHLRCKDMNAAGVSIAGAPCIAAGFNGSLAWGMTMVMADNQDVFLERLKVIDGRPHYLYQGRWEPVQTRTETIRIRGEDPRTIQVNRTRHGVLLDGALSARPILPFQPRETGLPYGLALSQVQAGDTDGTLQAFFELNLARSVEEALPVTRRIRAIALNMVVADRDSIAWRVTGTYPVRARGRGLLPSPGWTGEYDWKGYVDPASLPESLNPPQGYILTANNRTVPADHPVTLSSSWYWPERAERIEQMILATERHSLQTSMAMQLDTHSAFVPKLKKVYLEGETGREIARVIESWGDARARAKARQGLEMLRAFDADMSASSPGAALVGAMLHCATRAIFLDELGPEDSPAWRAFLALGDENYNATCDHIVARTDESPFWDDCSTASREDKAQILARVIGEAYELCERRLGTNHAAWRWGRLHAYTWETDAYRMTEHLDPVRRLFMSALWGYFNRGPHEAPGDHFTLNVAAYTMGRNFDVWLIPAMRIVVDFGLQEPMHAVNSTGQSDKPSSPHYDDATALWRQGRYLAFPFGEEGIRSRFGNVRKLVPR